MKKENCKHETGYYRFFKVTPSWRGCYRYTPDGEVDENTEMFDTITAIEFKTKYCQDCHKKLGIAK